MTVRLVSQVCGVLAGSIAPLIIMMTNFTASIKPLACRLTKQLAHDCALLEELRVIDYSLLLGVHYRSPGYASSPQVTDRVPICMHACMSWCLYAWQLTACQAVHCCSSKDASPQSTKKVFDMRAMHFMMFVRMPVNHLSAGTIP